MNKIHVIGMIAEAVAIQEGLGENFEKDPNQNKNVIGGGEEKTSTTNSAPKPTFFTTWFLLVHKERHKREINIAMEYANKKYTLHVPHHHDVASKVSPFPNT